MISATPALDDVGASVHGASISVTATHILYSLAANTNDLFPYTIRDGQGGTTTAANEWFLQTRPRRGSMTRDRTI